MKTELDMFLTAIGKAAGASCGGDPQTSWWTPEVKGVKAVDNFCQNK